MTHETEAETEADGGSNQRRCSRSALTAGDGRLRGDSVISSL
jgi:hypothetical protein